MKTNKKILERALIGLLLPLVRFALRHGLRYQECDHCLKQAFLIGAEDEIKTSGQTYTVSRASVLTGLQRKDIKRLSHPLAKEQDSTNLLTRVIGAWISNPKFIDKNSQARLLSFEGVDSQFAELVRGISADVSHYTVLYGLERSGNIIRHGKNIELVHRAYVPGDTFLEKIELLARDANDLIGAVEENIFSSPPTPNLHITTEYDNVCQQDIPKIRDWLLEQGTTFHEKVRRFIATFDKDSNQRLYKKVGGARIVVSSFSLTSPANSIGGNDA